MVLSDHDSARGTYVTCHAKRAVKSKFAKLICIVDMMAVSFEFR